MKTALFATGAMLFYAAGSIIIDQKLRQVSPFATMLFYALGVSTVAALGLLAQRQSGMALTMPQGNQYWLLVALAAAIVVADFCYFSAYTSGGSLIMVTTLVVLLPVFASLIKFALGGGLPSLAQLIGWLFAAVAVFLVSK